MSFFKIGLIFSIPFLSCATIHLYGQSSSGASANNQAKVNGFTNNALGRALWVNSFDKKLNLETRKKLFYFKDWNSEGVINDKYKIQKINYNLNDDELVFKVASDSIFILDKNNIDSFIINNERFKKYYLGSKSGNQYLKVLYASIGEDIQLLKHQHVTFSKAEVDPLMLKKSTVKTTRSVEYYLVKNKEHPVSIRLTKKSLLSKFPSRNKELITYAKTHKLSFRKEKDVIQILSHFSTVDSK